ncbi:MAG: sulfotransferase domain-containing protein [Planctomycetota bacterium]|jgi:hypothetical protein
MTNIFVTCFQKSGSSFLANVLQKVTRFEYRDVVQFFGHEEQDLYEEKLKPFRTLNTVTRQHVKGTKNNLDLMRKYGIRPVVSTRNIFDVLLSLYDHIENLTPVVPTGYVHEKYFQMNRDEKLTHLIRVHLPWYFNFFVSWLEASQSIDTLWISYEQFFTEQVRTTSRILQYYGLFADRETIKKAFLSIDARRKNIKFNVGISGRGKSLADFHKNAIIDLAKCWNLGNSIFEIIGISEAMMSSKGKTFQKPQVKEKHLSKACQLSIVDPLKLLS